MAKYIAMGIVVGVLYIFLGSAMGGGGKSPENMGMMELRQELHAVLDKKRAKGCDLTEIKELKRREDILVAKAAEDGKDIQPIRLNYLKKALVIARGLCDGNADTPLSEKHYKGSRSITLSIPGEYVQITQAVPEIKNSNSFHFPVESRKLINGQLELKLNDGDGPLYLETLPTSVKSSVDLKSNCVDAQNNSFGILAEPELLMASDGDLAQIKNMKALGIGWVRMAGRAGAVWDLIENAPLGRGDYNWGKMDSMVRALSDSEFKILCTIKPFHSKDQKDHGKLPINLSAYVDFVRHLAERYDGDGIDDCPSGAKVDCWQVHNEVDLSHFWMGTAYGYARLFKITSDAIREVDSGAKIALGGISNPGSLYNGRCTYVDILSELRKNGGKFDVFDVHWYKNYITHPDYNSKLVAFMGRELPAVLEQYGYKNVDVWFSETGAYSGANVVGRQGVLKIQSEVQQAKNLVRFYVHFLSNGVGKVFWTSMLETNASYLHGTDDYFNNIGLIYNGFGKNDKGKGKKKKSYITYQFMIKKLGCAQWQRTEKIKTGENGVFAYKIFRKSPKGPLWVIWEDS